uniref:Malic_M domain-containing protein n=1 Tax=Gongylonema pulchrum TaxID=637853 RepID=A0A183D0R4_9BILA
LIQFEDFANLNAYRLLDKFRNQYCTFNDDIQGTASVVVAGLLSCNKIQERKMSDQTFVFLGAGAVIQKVKPTGIIGVSTVRGAFSEEVIREMSQINQQPIIFALSNPTEKSECTAEEAYKYSNGQALFASGSPFPNLRLNGKLYKPGQGNNSYIFPGVALGIILFQVRHIEDELFLIAARVIQMPVDVIIEIWGGLAFLEENI